MSFAIVTARNLVARSLRGSADQAVRDEAFDAIQMAMGDLNNHNWEHRGVTATLSATAGTSDYTATGALAGLRKIYSVVWANTITLTQVSRRTDDQIRPVKQNSTPVFYDLNQRASAHAITLLPTPATNETFVVRGYIPATIPSATAGNLDIDDDFKFWPVYQAKAMLLADRNGQQARASFWQQKANDLWRKMVFSDKHNPDEGVAFRPRGSGRLYPPDHAQRGIEDAYGF